jgi:divalent metal cation (Fe/Co/Zn/Cd) transporter
VGASAPQTPRVQRLAFPRVGAEPEVPTAGLERFAWLSIAAAVVTIALKTGAFTLTGSVGLLSDAAESRRSLPTTTTTTATARRSTSPPAPRG